MLKEKLQSLSKKYFVPQLIFFALVLTLFPGKSYSKTFTKAPGESDSEVAYTLKIKEGTPLKVNVTLTVNSSLDTLKFYGPSVGIDPEEWMQYVKNVEMETVGGKQIKLKQGGPGKWIPASDYKLPAIIKYEVDLSFALDPWPAGNEHAAFYTSNTLYAVGEALFMSPGSFSSALVTFDLPSSWVITTPYNPTDKKNTYQVSALVELLDNCLVMGQHETYYRTKDNFRYIMAMIGPFADQKDLISNTVDKVLDQYFDLFGEAPDVTYMQAMFLSDEEDGEAFLQSSGFRTSLLPTEDHLILWGNQLSHEIFHKWLSSDGIIHPVSYDDSQWFSEGFSEYYANLALLRTGAFSMDDFITKMENNIGLYLYWGWSPAFKDMTLRKAGGEKWFHRLAVYNGGWSAAFSLDVYIRSQTENRKSLDDVMLAMYNQFGKTNTPYKFSDLPNVVHESTRVNADEFFSNYIEGNKFLPVEESIRMAGFEAGVKGYAGEIYIWPSSNVTPKQGEIRNGILFGSDSE